MLFQENSLLSRLEIRLIVVNVRFLSDRFSSPRAVMSVVWNTGGIRYRAFSGRVSYIVQYMLCM